MSGDMQVTLIGGGVTRRRQLGLGVEGYAISLDDILTLFGELRAYPVTLIGSVDEESAELFAAWLGIGKQRFVPEEMPWVPVGRVGPLLVLGHADPTLSPPPLPHGAFQPVILRRDDYERQLAATTLVVRRFASEGLAERYPPGVGLFPRTLVWPSERSNAIEFIQNYFVQTSVDSEQLDNLTARHAEIRDDQLPLGYAAALAFLCNKYSVFAPAPCRLLAEQQKMLPKALAHKVSVVAEVSGDDSHHLFCASSVLPQHEAEDKLYSELGNGWKIHWLLRAPDLSGVASPAPHQGQESGAVLVAPRRKGPKNADEVRASEERVVTLRESQWTQFDPRSLKAKPEGIWQWALCKAIREGATDLHFEPGEVDVVVRARFDGLLEEILRAETRIGREMVASCKTICGLDTDVHRPIDGGFKVVLELPDKGIQEVRIRASGYPVHGDAQKLALRILARSGKVPEISDLMNGRPYSIFTRAISRPEGLILVCGPTGAGKTTTLFAGLHALNSPERNITTLEHPVEIVLPGLNQAEVNERRKVGWDSLTSAFLRQDPDIGLLGEIRDEDTAKTSLRVALTGHLVFASLHTLSCPTSVLRMVDLGANRNMLAEALLLTVSQRLVRRVCTKCAESAVPKPEDAEIFHLHGMPVPKHVRIARSCPECRRGYKGRVAAFEMLPNVPRVRTLIEKAAPAEDYFAWMKAHQLPTVFEDALRLAAEGETTMDEALSLQGAWDGTTWQEFLN